jgi:hypothetical protein
MEVNRINKVALIMLVVTLFLGINACKDKCDDPTDIVCKNYDPCYGKEKTSAYFIVEESLGVHWIECDTIVGRGNVSAVRFTALQEADSFIWTLGSETVHSKSFIRQSFPPNEHIPVSLIVINKNPNTKCHPLDDGRDTFNRILYVWGSESYWDEASKKYVVNNPLPIQGQYQGFFASNPGKQVVVTLEDTVSACSKADVKSRVLLKSINLPEGYFQPCYDDENCGYFETGWNKRAIAATLGLRVYRMGKYNKFYEDSIYEVRGFMQLSRDLREVEIEIEYYPLWDEIEKKTLKKDNFKGIKIK